ncbi:MAG: BMP family ABC transporter substrate-binding protein [Chloroflexi bacterium]|nr:BMP family ABC transporter substrate-binding protein [Chloroflexota bacterium]MCL5074300.1 BMP family ABC transporter substrate-binding protein [Chloroflexota bacterium]
MNKISKRLTVVIAALLAVSIALAGCAPAAAPTPTPTKPPAPPTPTAVVAAPTPTLAPTATPTAVPKKEVRVAEVFFGALGDRSYNDYAMKGLKRAKEKLGVNFDYVETKVFAEIEGYMRDLARTGKYDLIIFAGNIGEPVLKKLSAEFPNQKFLTITAMVDAPNIASYDFKMEEAAFLLGVVAGRITKTNVTGFIGGVQIPQMKKYGGGFEAGLRWVNPKAQLLTTFVGSWDDPVKGQDLALAQYANKADIIFTIAGASGLGVIEAGKKQNKYVIGFMDQRYLAPDNILLCYVANMDIVVYNVIEQVVKGTFKPGRFYLGLKENGVWVTIDDAHPLVTAAIKKEVEDLKQKVVSGEIVVPDDPAGVEAFLKKHGKL